MVPSLGTSYTLYYILYPPSIFSSIYYYTSLYHLTLPLYPFHYISIISYGFIFLRFTTLRFTATVYSLRFSNLRFTIPTVVSTVFFFYSLLPYGFLFYGLLSIIPYGLLPYGFIYGCLYRLLLSIINHIIYHLSFHITFIIRFNTSFVLCIVWK